MPFMFPESPSDFENQLLVPLHRESEGVFALEVVPSLFSKGTGDG